jgi:hypothetical protein
VSSGQSDTGNALAPNEFGDCSIVFDLGHWPAHF